MKLRLVLTLFVLAMVTQPMNVASADPGLAVSPSSDASSLVSALVGSGVSATNVSYTGAPLASGTFSGGTGIIGFESGIVMTSGSATNVIGPNVVDGVTTNNGTPGDVDLTGIAGNSSDAAVLEFDFTPNASPIYFNFVFGSEEYNEFANSTFNDVFAFFVNGSNCAMVPDTSTPVSVNNINGGNPFGTNAQNPQYFRNNDIQDGGGSINTEMDGLTTVLTCQANVTPSVTNHLKLAIADTGDSALDSAVFLETNSLSTEPTQRTLSVSVSGDGSGDVTSDPSGISCPGIEGPCQNQFDQNTVVTLTATPDVGSAFGGWGGDCSAETTDVCTLTMDADKSVSATFDPIPTAEADLSVSKTDGPDPVKAGNALSYTIDVSNAGPSDVAGIQVDDAMPVVLSGVSWTCSIQSGTGSCAAPSGSGGIHTTVDLDAGSTARFFATGTVSTSATGTIPNTATIAPPEGTTDPNTGNNSATANTAVTASSTPDSAAGFCSGTTSCTVSTDTGAGATPGDPTVSTITLPSGADPQVVTVTESSGAQSNICGGRPCSGQIVTFESTPGPTFAGVTDRRNPAVVRVTYDRSVRGGLLLFVDKGIGKPRLVLPCLRRGIAFPSPCISTLSLNSQTRDLTYTVLFLEGDPTLGRR